MVGIFDTIFVKELPVSHPRAAIGFNIVGEPGERVQMKLEIIGPTGDAILKAPQQSFVLPDVGTAFVHQDLQNLVMNDFGRHAIQIDLGDGTTPKSAWFTLRKIEDQK